MSVDIFYVILILIMLEVIKETKGKECDPTCGQCEKANDPDSCYYCHLESEYLHTDSWGETETGYCSNKCTLYANSRGTLEVTIRDPMKEVYIYNHCLHNGCPDPNIVMDTTNKSLPLNSIISWNCRGQRWKYAFVGGSIGGIISIGIGVSIYLYIKKRRYERNNKVNVENEYQPYEEELNSKYDSEGSNITTE